MNVNWFVVIGAISILATIFWFGRKSRNSEVDRLTSTIANQKFQLAQIMEQAEAAIQKLRTEQTAQQTNLQNKDVAIGKIEIQLAASQNCARSLMEANSKLHELYSSTLESLRSEGALFPSAVRWADNLREFLDQIIVERLELPPHPAPSAAIQVKEARALARQVQQEVELLRNRLNLYEAQAPWLVDYVEYSVDEIIAGLQEEQEIRRTYATGDDPVKLFLSRMEWDRLSDSERNQLALDRYWESSRKRSAWTAGIQYERYIGHLYEKEGFDVEYHGALRGREDLGIDLICRKGQLVRVVQCKRLAPLKAIPVRENVVAQIFGSAMFFAMRSGMDVSLVKPVIVTTYELSSEARQFAELLGVSVRESVALEQYPCIKCNISERTGERIYHLPFDQQYDSAKIGNVTGEFYAMTVAEAERARFHRAFRWHGAAS